MSDESPPLTPMEMVQEYAPDLEVLVCRIVAEAEGRVFVSSAGPRPQPDGYNLDDPPVVHLAPAVDMPGLSPQAQFHVYGPELVVVTDEPEGVVITGQMTEEFTLTAHRFIFYLQQIPRPIQSFVSGSGS